MPVIFARYYNTCYENANGVCEGSAWENWARWLVLGLVIAAALFAFFSVSCISARRRRRMGYQPYRGTAWTLGLTPAGHNPPTYDQQVRPQPETQSPYYWTGNINNGNAPPAYSPPPNTNNLGGRNDTELTQPQAVYGGYRSGESVYEPPKGPPPARN